MNLIELLTATNDAIPKSQPLTAAFYKALREHVNVVGISKEDALKVYIAASVLFTSSVVTLGRSFGITEAELTLIDSLVRASTVMLDKAQVENYVKTGKLPSDEAAPEEKKKSDPNAH